MPNWSEKPLKVRRSRGVMDESLSLQDIGPVEKLEINSCSSKGSMKSSDILRLLEGGGFKHIAASDS